jgi:hypothetical protein
MIRIFNGQRNTLNKQKRFAEEKKIEWNRPLSKPFDDKEMEVVNKLIYERHSIRD